jgi:hypothetical protein
MAKAASEKKPAAEKKAPAEKAPAAPTALVSQFVSHGSVYKTLRVSRPVGDKLKTGSKYDVKVADDGTLTLKPQA